MSVKRVWPTSGLDLKESLVAPIDRERAIKRCIVGSGSPPSGILVVPSAGGVREGKLTTRLTVGDK